jgi:uncharacterized UPF0160 family protein
MKKIITHNGPFHADDVMAVAALQLLLEKKGETYKVVRTRDEHLWPTGDYVVDVGGVFDPATHRYDHHQEGGAGERENRVPYSSIGLVWRYHGRALVSERVWEAIDVKLVQPVDLQDIGKEPVDAVSKEGVRQYTLDDMVHAFYPLQQDAEAFDHRFTEAVGIFKTLLSYEMDVRTKEVAEEDVVRACYERAEDKRLIILDTYSSGKKALSDYPEPLYIAYPNVVGPGWRISCVRSDPDGFATRKLLPETWAGKNHEELAGVSGVSDAEFCHNGRWIAGAKTKEGAIALAKKALET